MRAAVVVFPGSNCDRDLAVALEVATGRTPLMVWHKERDFPKVDLIALPGGFSFGDYLRCGAMAALAPVMAEVVARANAGVPVLGICNGFQILTECGLLPGALLRNAALRFLCRDVHLRVETTDSPFTCRYESGQVVRIPIAHHDGNYFAEPELLARLEGEGQVAFRYCDQAGRVSAEANPNGSADNIAGLFDARRSVLGMMPHPERLADAALGGCDGAPLFRSLVEMLG